MNSKLLAVIKNKWFLVSMLLIITLGIFGSQEIIYMARQYMAGDTPWDSNPREINGRVVLRSTIACTLVTIPLVRN